MKSLLTKNLTSRVRASIGPAGARQEQDKDITGVNQPNAGARQGPDENMTGEKGVMRIHVGGKTPVEKG